MTVQIDDPWFEGLYKTEFNANPVKFLNTFKSLLTKERAREQKTISLLQRYKNGEMPISIIAEKLNTDKEEILELMTKHNIYLIDNDYDLSADHRTIQKYLTD